jgi:DNA polymerase zeta
MNDGPSLDAAENPFINSSTPSKESANSGEPSQVPVDSSVDLLSSRTFSQTFRKRTQIPPPHTLVTSAASVFQYEIEPPTASNLLATIEDHGLQRRVYRSPWYSDPEDSPDGPREYAGLLYHLKGGEGLDTLSGWQTDANIAVMPVSPTYAASGGWEFAGTPPSASQTKIWLNRVKEQQELVRKLRAYRSQVKVVSATSSRS